MKFNINAIAIALLFLVSSCEKETKESLLPYPEDITFNELALDRFSFTFHENMKAGSEKAGYVSFSGKKLANGDFEGFALSNKNYRSYPWSLSYTFGNPAIAGEKRQTALDSTIFSVFTNVPNRTENYLVGNANSGKAKLTFDKASKIEHILVANTTYGYLQAVYGSTYSGTLNSTTQVYSSTGTKVRNPSIPNTSTAMYGVFYLPGNQGQDLIRLSGFALLKKQEAGDKAKQQALSAGKTEAEAQAAYDKAYADLKVGQIKLIISGYLKGQKVGEKVHYLAVRENINPEFPTHSYNQNNWLAVDLEALGNVDELQFSMDGDYKDATGKLLSPAYFCVDGIRIKK